MDIYLKAKSELEKYEKAIKAAETAKESLQKTRDEFHRVMGPGFRLPPALRGWHVFPACGLAVGGLLSIFAMPSVVALIVLFLCMIGYAVVMMLGPIKIKSPPPWRY